MTVWRNWIARLTSDQVVAGSSPVTVEYKILVGGLAQSEERDVSNVEAPGSKPGLSSVISYFTEPL